MTTEQLAIIVPAIVAIVTVWIIARTQTRIKRQTLESQRRLAQQERARAAYEDMLHMVAWVMEIVSATKPILERSESALENLNLPKCGVHVLRHSAAARIVQTGGSAKTLQTVLGHRSAAFSLATYAHLFDADLDALADRLDERKAQ